MNQQPQSLIKVAGVSHTYRNGVCALSEINLDVGVGLFGLLGTNGAGKSTLMKILCTLQEPLSGQVSIAGFDVVTQRHQARSQFGFLPQDFGAWSTYKVESLLDTLAALSGIADKQQRKTRIDAVLAEVGLTEVAQRKIKKLSGGMLRRVGIAQALLHSPKVLILDEPTVGLDPEERLRFRQMIAELSRERCILLSTHIVADLGLSCTQLAIIHGGKIEFKGSPLDIIRLAQGKVFEVVATPAIEQNLEAVDNFEIVARSYQNNQSVFRGVSSNGFIPEGAKPAENITLEEAYLAFTLDKGRDLTSEVLN